MSFSMKGDTLSFWINLYRCGLRLEIWSTLYAIIILIGVTIIKITMIINIVINNRE